MQRSSESIGAIAAALAKAQIELTNPEKSLTATVASPFPREDARTFRYAPLSSGLEIVRKCLGKHEIAAIQTTAIDGESGLIRLTTMLAHASGEWMCSEWPVCPVSETSAPHRLGAALTYARRHSLFTLVGIAGDDDRDAPDLATSALQGQAQTEVAASREVTAPGPTSKSVLHRRAPRSASTPYRPLLSPAASASQCDQLLEELKLIGSADDLASWAHRILQVKNALRQEDADRLEEAFAGRLPDIGEFKDDRAVDLADETGLPAVTDDAPASGAPKAAPETFASTSDSGRRRRNHSGADAPHIDKSVLAFPEPRRIRDKDHLKFVARQNCLICDRAPSDAHHLRFAQLRALGRKVSDEFTVPLCRMHHRELHRVGDELSWWQKNSIDPMQHAYALWTQSHPNQALHVGTVQGRDPAEVAAKVHQTKRTHLVRADDLA